MIFLISLVALCDATIASLYHTREQFSVSNNSYKGIHIRDDWGHSLAIFDFQLSSGTEWGSEASNIEKCRQICLTLPDCKGVSWNLKDKICTIAEKKYINQQTLEYSPGSIYFYERGSDSIFYPALDGIFYSITNKNGTFDENRDSFCKTKQIKRLAWPKTPSNEQNIIDYAKNRGADYSWIDLIGESDGQTLKWGDGTTVDKNDAEFSVDWNIFIPNPAFIINEDGVKAVPKTDLYPGMCMANVLSIEPWEYNENE